jgi:hypothetical protein
MKLELSYHLAKKKKMFRLLNSENCKNVELLLLFRPSKMARYLGSF